MQILIRNKSLRAAKQNRISSAIRGRMIYLGLSLILILSACNAGSANGSKALLTLEDIPDGFSGPTIISTTTTSATISFDSGVPTVCNAPYGLTIAYGQIATIPMLSGATLDHVLTFDDLEPGMTYHYQVLVTDELGNVYQSNDFTFVTDEEAEGFDDKTNWLSLDSGATVVEVSSNFGAAENDQIWGANMALDTKVSTAWSSDGDGDDAFITIQLGEPVAITTLAVQTRFMTNDTAQIFSFTVTTDTGEEVGPFDLPDGDQVYEFEVSFTASSLRFDVGSSNGGNTGFVSLAAYGTPAGAN